MCHSASMSYVKIITFHYVPPMCLPCTIPYAVVKICKPWWRHQMETFSALLALCVGNSPVSGEFLAQRPVTRSFDVFFDLRLNKRFSKQWWGWWFETLPRPLWRHSNIFNDSTGKHIIRYGSKIFFSTPVQIPILGRKLAVRSRLIFFTCWHSLVFWRTP